MDNINTNLSKLTSYYNTKKKKNINASKCNSTVQQFYQGYFYKLVVKTL